MTAHATSLRPYVFVLLALIVLTALTTGVAYVDLGFWNTPVALAIAAGKAVLVGLFFMHLRDSTRLIVAVVVSTLFWFGILIVLTMSDYLTRRFMTFG